MGTSKVLLVAFFIPLSISVAFANESQEETSKLPVEESDLGLKLQCDQLRSKILSLESSIEERSKELERKDEVASKLEKIIHEKSEEFASLQNDMTLLQKKVAAEKANKVDAKTVELEEQIEALKKKRDAFKDESIVCEYRTRELSAQLESVHGAWLPPWLATQMGRYMAVMSAKWNEHEKPEMDIFLQMATNTSKLAQKWAELHLETAKPLFYESFDENFEGRWIVSAKEDYKGVWKYSKSNGHQDYGLLASHKERRYAIVKELKEPISLKCGTIVLQFEVRFQNGLKCGGAYLKYLRPPQDARWFSKEFDNESPYSILFGPDKCHYPSGRVLFIVKHKNPKTGDFVEHHLTVPPAVPTDRLTHVYSAIITPDNYLRILIDGMEQLKPFNFLSSEDFKPPFISSNTIPDSKATKPYNSDVDAPIEIEDEDAVKPEGWLDDEPEEIDNPKWKAPKIDNLKWNEAPGCGEWKRPMKRNTAYKGKWHAPPIDNANYEHIWNPSDTLNPHCLELDFEPIKAIGIEIWTMQDGILFDNILIADDEKVAASYRETAWKPKYDVEKEKQKFDKTAPHSGAPAVLKMLFNLTYLIVEFSSPEEYKSKIIEFEMRPIMVSCLIGLFGILLVLRGVIRVIEKEKEEKIRVIEKEKEKKKKKKKQKKQEKKQQQPHQQPPHSDSVEVNESGR